MFILLQRRHQAVWVHRQIRRLAVLAEWAADIDALMGEPQLTNRPHHLLDVGRRVAAPDLHHDGFLSLN
jgi:hypothetical protein